MERYIEAAVPKKFLYDLGLYIQTCAHIELVACSLICALEELNENTVERQIRFGKLRKSPTSALLTALEVANKFSNSSIKNEFAEFVGWLRTYVTNRHIAVHGAFFQTSKLGVLRVDYTHNDGTAR